MITLRQTLVAASAVIAAVAVTGCTSDNAGTPQPIPSGEKSSETSAPSTSGSPFADIKACDLFDPVTSTQGFDASKEVKFESDNGCQARKPTVGTASMYLVDAGIEQLNNAEGTKSQGTVAGKDAVIISGFSGSSSCLIGIPVTPNARATVSMTLSSGSNEQACETAKSIAEQIAPKLPSGN